MDFKARTQKRATQKMQVFLQIQLVGQLTTWGYGVIRWILHTNYQEQGVASPMPPWFHILKGLPLNLTTQERQLVMAALFHDLVDTPYHPSKLGRSITVPDPYVQWLCEHHQTAKQYPDHEDLHQL